MTAKELIAELEKFPPDTEVYATDWEHIKKVRGVGETCHQVNLRCWLTDEELFEEERKCTEEDRRETEQLLKANGK